MGKMGAAVAAACAAGACVAAGVMVGRSFRRRRRWIRAAKVVEELDEACATPLGRLRQVVDAMAVEMHAGLASDGGSKLKMLVTYVYTLPSGKEEGIYYGLDLGSSNNVRVVRIGLTGEKNEPFPSVYEQTVPESLLTSSTEELFDFVAGVLKEVVEGDDDDDHGRELGFTFSFPLMQTSSLSGNLIKWAKGFAVDDAVGKDISRCLEEAMTRKGLLHMRVAALINDTVGTLALSHYRDEDTIAGVILGTGTNACYLERTDAIIKSQGLLTTGEMVVVVNMEWGNFWSSHLPRTGYDFELDANDQGFEKLISGMYLGDIVRRVVLRMSEESESWNASSKLHTPFVLTMPMIAAMHEDDSPGLSEVARILAEILEIEDVGLDVRKLIVKTCDVVTRRAARLAAAGIVGILKKMGRDGSGGKDEEMKRTVVGVEGSLYTRYTSFREYLNEAVEQILGHEVASHVVINVVEDGAGIGPALLAAAAASSSS